MKKRDSAKGKADHSRDHIVKVRLRPSEKVLLEEYAKQSSETIASVIRDVIKNTIFDAEKMKILK